MAATDGNLYELVVGRPGPSEPPALPPARASAAVVLWRRIGPAPQDVEVFWIQRAETQPFMGGWHAFPGGGLARGDAEVPVEGEPEMGEGPAAAGIPESLRDKDEPSPDLPPGLVACALRELHEETGLIASASRLVYAGRWVTPPFAPLRFDNRFFLLEWPAEARSQPVVHPGEIESGEWIAPGAAWQAWQRGAVIAAPPILHILAVLAQEGPEAGLARLRDPGEANLGPLRRVEMRPGVLMFPLQTHTLPPAGTTNCYLLGTGDCALIDPGSSFERENERLERALAAARERLGRRVVAIWLTHHHPDHVGGVERLRRTLGVPVLAHAATAERLAARGIAVDGELRGGQRIVLGGEPEMPVVVLHTPGHARGHLCFLDETRRSLLCGDMVAGMGTIVIDPPEGDMDQYLGSLARLASLRPATLFPSHGPVVRNAVATLRQLVDHRLWREARVLAAWNEGRRTPEEMLSTVYDDAPQEAWPLARRQILAHLERLRRHGTIP